MNIIEGKCSKCKRNTIVLNSKCEDGILLLCEECISNVLGVYRHKYQTMGDIFDYEG